MYLHRLITAVGACVAGLGGIDALVFTGGVGEGSSQIRELTTAKLDWLGVMTGPPRASDGLSELTAPGASVRTFVVTAREDLEMARHVWSLASKG